MSFRRATRRRWEALKEQGVDADDLLRIMNVNEPPVPVFEIAERLGVDVLVADGGYSGQIDPGSDPPRIIINRAHPTTRQRFTVAHELGHLFLHEGPQYRHGSPFSGREIDANRFAADLLMPMWMLETFGRAAGRDPARLARIFKVSEQAMEIRLGLAQRRR